MKSSAINKLKFNLFGNLISAQVVVFVFALFLFSSCLKKIDGVNELNSNIYDYEYSGECWFYIDDAYSYFNDFGQQFVKIEAVLPEEKFPGLQPNLIFITCNVNEEQEVIFNSYINTKGDFEFFYDAQVSSNNEYCLEAGLFIQDRDTTINRFTLCTNL